MGGGSESSGHYPSTSPGLSSIQFIGCWPFSAAGQLSDASVSLRTLFGVDLLDQLLRSRVVDGQDGLEAARRPVKNLDRYRMLNPTAHPCPGRTRSDHCCAARPVHHYSVRLCNYRHCVSPYTAFQSAMSES